MKKLLLATSALVGAGALVATASAGAPTLSIGGNLDFRLVGGQVQATAGATVEDNGDTIDVGAAENGYDLTRANSRSEIKFRANGESDGGTKYGATIDYRYQANSTDESYIYVAGDWGRVHLGDDDGAMDHRVANAGWIAPGAYLIDDTTTFIDMETNGNSDGTKITYFSPNIGGFEAAFSMYEAVGTVKVAGDDEHQYEDIFEAAVSYSGSNGDVSYNVGLGIQSGSLTEAGATALNKTVTPTGGEARELKADDLSEIVVGGTLSFGAISLALSYNSEGDSGAIDSVPLAAERNVEANARALDGAKTEGREFTSAGIAYNLGDGMSVGLSYGEASTSYYRRLTGYNAANQQITQVTSPTNSADRASFSGNVVEVEDTQTLVAIDFGFPILEGMSGYAGIAFSEWERESITQAIGAGPTSLNLGSRTEAAPTNTGGGAVANYQIGRTAEATTYVIGTTVSF